MPNRSLYQDSSPSDFLPNLEARRQRAIDTLTDAFASDLITVEEYEARVSVAASAHLRRELDDIVSDLPVVDNRTKTSSPKSGRSENSNPPSPHAFRPPNSGGAPFSVACVMGDRRLTGDWLDSDHVNTFTLMGSTRLDLRDAELPESGPVRIEVFVLMGETVVIVPRGLPVRMNAMPFMGEAIARRDVDQNVRGARRWVEISGFVVMGSVVVKAAD